MNARARLITLWNINTKSLKDVIRVSLCLRLIASVFVAETKGDDAPLWPEGKYGLPMVAPSLCPSSYKFSWVTGSRYQDTAGANQRSANFHLASRVNNNSVEQHFCIKDVDTNDDTRSSWPEGRYCVYKKGPTCPYGLTEGWVFWDDKNEENQNAREGILPNGTYNQDTKIYFCCQTVGSVFHSIYLPVDKPFYLIAFKSFFAKNPVCQDVNGAIANVEYIGFATQWSNIAVTGVPFPYGADRKPLYIYYCYYSACKETLTALIGSFHSPNFPNMYKNNMECKWTILIPPNGTIDLSFDVFELEKNKACTLPGCPCDYVEIREYFSNDQFSLHGRYCMGVNNTPPKITSSAKKLTVLFHSDTSKGAKGFKASFNMTENWTNQTTQSGNETISKKNNMEPISYIVGIAFAAYFVVAIGFVIIVLNLPTAKFPSKKPPKWNIYKHSESSQRRFDNRKASLKRVTIHRESSDDQTALSKSYSGEQMDDYEKPIQKESDNEYQEIRMSNPLYSRNTKAKPPPPPKLILGGLGPPQREKPSSGGSLPKSPTYYSKPSSPRYSSTKPVVPPPLPPQRHSPSSSISGSVPDVTGETPGQYTYIENRQCTPAKPQVKRPILPPPKPPSSQTRRLEPTTGFRTSFPRETSQPRESLTDSQTDRIARPISPTSKVLPPLSVRGPGSDLSSEPRPLVKRRAPPRPTLHDESES